MTTLPWTQLGIAYVVFINLITVGLFWFDKWMARGRGWRIPEAMLWLSAALGGSPGALLAMHWFRHKTKKLSFQLVFVVILFLQIAGVAFGYAWYNNLLTLSS